MTTITFDIDETIPTQDIYCKELNAFLHIDTINESEVKNKIQAAQAQIAQIQQTIDVLNPLLVIQQAAQLGI